MKVVKDILCDRVRTRNSEKNFAKADRPFEDRRLRHGHKRRWVPAHGRLAH
jgi:hypothetical protein